MNNDPAARRALIEAVEATLREARTLLVSEENT